MFPIIADEIGRAYVVVPKSERMTHDLARRIVAGQRGSASVIRDARDSVSGNYVLVHISPADGVQTQITHQMPGEVPLTDKECGQYVARMYGEEVMSKYDGDPVFRERFDRMMTGG